MGNCFGRCMKKNIRKPKNRSKFLRTGSCEEIMVPQDEEFLELEQRDEQNVEAPIPTENSGTCKIPRPNKLSFKKSNFVWKKNENRVMSGNLNFHKNIKSPADSVMPLLNRENSYVESSSFTSNHKWDQFSNGATPGSSVDLEWENEIEFNSTSNFGATEELQWMVLTENTNNSWRSSPLSNSNGLEWDGDFASVDISEIVSETKRMTADLEDNAMQENTNSTFRDIENNY